MKVQTKTSYLLEMDDREMRDSDYVPVNPSDEAKICLNCPLKSCRPEGCTRLREERKKLKEKKV